MGCLQKWGLTTIGCLQYMHGVGARFAHYLHMPGPLLHDVGFELLPVGAPQVFVVFLASPSSNDFGHFSS